MMNSRKPRDVGRSFGLICGHGDGTDVGCVHLLMSGVFVGL